MNDKVKLSKIGSKTHIKQFEQEQKEYGTEVAIGNLLWQIGSEIMYKAGVKSIKTIYHKTNKNK